MSSADLTRINTNIQALNALNALNKVNSKMSVHQLRLATGKRINSAADDAAGFTIASKLKVKSEGLGTALDNIGSAKNLMTVSEGHLTNIQDILTKMKSKAQQAANGTLGTEERAAVMAELRKFNEQIDSEVQQAQWAGTGLLGDGAGAAADDLKFQIGTGTNASYDELTFNIARSVWSGGGTTFDSSGLGVLAAVAGTASIATTAAVATVGLAAGALAISGTINSLVSQLTSGHYTMEVTATGAGATTGVSVEIVLRDSNGDAVTLDADGAATGAVGSSLTYTVAAGSSDPGSIDLGVGIKIDLGAIASTDAGDVGSAIYSLDYSEGGNSSALDVDTMENAQTFMGAIDDAINQVSAGLSYIGAQVNRMSFQEESLSVAKTNTESAYSRIVDADMALEQLESTKLQILQQTATAMLAQANTAPQSVLSLFG